MRDRALHDGRTDGLKPLEILDLTSVNSFVDLVRSDATTVWPLLMKAVFEELDGGPR